MEPEPEPEPEPAPAPLEAAGSSWRPFDCVDEEVLLKIFARLAPKSLVRAGLVCREWHAQPCDDELWAALHNNVLVDRSTVLGNPFPMGPDGHAEAYRHDVCGACDDLFEESGRTAEEAAETWNACTAIGLREPG